MKGAALTDNLQLYDDECFWCVLRENHFLESESCAYGFYQLSLKKGPNFYFFVGITNLDRLFCQTFSGFDK